MSKSLGNVIDPFQVIDIYGVDALRYYLFREVGVRPGRQRVDRGLRDALHHRAGQRVRQPREPHARDDRRTATASCPRPTRRRSSPREFDGLRRRGLRAHRPPEISAALDAIWQLVRALNQYVQEEEPWKLAKDPAAAERLDSVLYGLAEGLRVVSVLLLPFLPEKAERLLAALGAEERSLDRARFGAVGGGATLGELEPLFPRVEREPRRRPRRGRHPLPPRRLQAAGRRARRAGARGGRHADRDGRHGRRRRSSARSRAARRARGGVRDRRPPPERGDRLRPDARPRADRARRGRPARARDRRDRARLLPRLRAARGPAARVRGADRPRARGSACRS